MNKPLLLLDFDGVVNFEATVNAFKKAENTPHYVRKTSLHADGFEYRVTYSGEVVYRLNSLRQTRVFEWLWLSTWRYFTREIDQHLHTDSDGYVPWTETDGQGFPGYMENEKNAAKLSHVIRLNEEEPRPFVWVDDEATVNFDSSMLSHDVPHLVIAPDSRYGLRRDELDQLEEFMRQHG